MDVENEKPASNPETAAPAADASAESFPPPSRPAAVDAKIVRSAVENPENAEPAQRGTEDAEPILAEMSAEAFKEIMKAGNKSRPATDDLPAFGEEPSAEQTAAVRPDGSGEQIPEDKEVLSETDADQSFEFKEPPAVGREVAPDKSAELGYQIKLEVFEGPLDLLLFLIKKKQIDIHDIPIAVITREYLIYLDRKDQINLDREGEFLLMAAYLIYIKSQMVLPREQPSVEAEDPRRALVEQLLDYQKIKAAAGLLREKEDERLQTWIRTHRPPLPEAEEYEILEVSLFDLAECFFQLMKRREGDDMQVLKGKEVSLEEKMKEIIAVLEQNEYLDFLEYLLKQETLQEALVAFFCLLEMVKTRTVIAVQETLFHTIKVWLRREAVLPFPPDPDGAAKESS